MTSSRRVACLLAGCGEGVVGGMVAALVLPGLWRAEIVELVHAAVGRIVLVPRLVAHSVFARATDRGVPL